MAWLGVRAGAINLLVAGVEVVEVLPFAGCTVVPLTVPHFRGISNVRGSLYSVVDLPALLGFAPVTAGPEARLLLLAPGRIRNTALLVNRLLGLYPEPPAGLGAADGAAAGGPADTDRSPPVPPPAVVANLTGLPGFNGLLGPVHHDAEGLAWQVLDCVTLVTLGTFLDVGAAAQPGTPALGTAA